MMKINQEKEFKPLTITIENKEEYIALVQIIDEANNIPTEARQYMETNAAELGIFMSDYFTNDV